LFKHTLSLIEYGIHELHPLVINNTWYLSTKEVALAFNTTISEIVESIDMLSESKHYSYESVEYEKGKTTSTILFFSKVGMIRLAYHLKTDDALKFLEFVEEINVQNQGEDRAHNFYGEVEDLLKDRLKKLKENEDATLEEINHFILTLDNLIKKRDSVKTEEKNSGSNIGNILETVVNLAQAYTVPQPAQKR